MQLTLHVPEPGTLETAAEAVARAVWRVAGGEARERSADARGLTLVRDAVEEALERRLVGEVWRGAAGWEYHLEVPEEGERFTVELAGEIIWALETVLGDTAAVNLLARDFPALVAAELAGFVTTPAGSLGRPAPGGDAEAIFHPL